MSTILDRIVEATRERVARRKRRYPLAYLQDQPFFHGPTLSLRRALEQKGPVAVIAELKKASPSRGLLRRRFDVSTLARGYKQGGAAAISVLTEPEFFQGSLDYLAQVRSQVDLPLLRKDFIVDPYQLYEARAYGADAVLLIATILPAEALAELHDAARALGLECLVELYDEREMEKLDWNRVQILGVNNRDLRTFEVNVHRGVRLLQRAPASVVRVSESGLRNGRDLAYLASQGVQAALIGETFMRAEEPGQALRDMLREAEREMKRSRLKLVS